MNAGIRVTRRLGNSSLLLVVLGALLAGCSGGSSPSGGNPPGPAASTTTLTASPNPAAPGTTVTLTAMVTSSSGSITGTVTFYDGTTSLGTGTVSNGTATFSVGSFAASTTHQLSATYSGDASHTTSTSASVSLAIGAPVATTTTLTALPNPATPGTAVTLTATVTSSGSAITGTVTFYDGATALGTGTVTNGTASLSVSTFAAGSAHILSAAYTGDATHAASTSATVSLSVSALASSTTTLMVTPNPATPGATVTLAATVTSSTSAISGIVTFYDGTTSLGTATVSSGVATLTVGTFAASTTHSLSASYAGDATHAGSTSGTVSEVIGAATGAASIDAHGSFSFATANQTISGFGAAEAFYLNYLDSHPYAPELYKALFDPTAGLGLTYLRLQNLYNGSATGFDPDTPAIVTAANAAHGTPLTLLMSSWSPPANLKSNGTVNGCATTNGVCTGTPGTLVQVSGAYDYADYATYWYNSLTAYATLGVVPSYISIQNEPDFTATYTGCRFNPTEATYNGTNFAGYGKAFDAVYKRLQSMSTPPTMIGPETLSVGQSFLDMAAQIPAGETDTYAHHLYNVPSGGVSGSGTITPGGSPDTGVAALTAMNAAYPTATKFMTEYYDTPGFYNAWMIHNALVDGNDNAYVFWQAVWPSTLDTAKDQAGDQQGLLYIDNPFASQTTWVFPHGWTYNDSYYALKHYSYYVRPGYIRYAATMDNNDERISVYQSVDKKTTVIVVLNVSTTVTDGLSLDLTGITYSNSAMYRSTFSQPITSGERWASLGSYIAASASSGANNSGGINLPPESVVTIVLTN